MRRALLIAAVFVYWVAVGHGHTPYFVALMLAAIRSDWAGARMHE